MDELTFVGVDDAGTHVVVRDAQGTHYQLAMSSALAAALHRRRTPVGAAPSAAQPDITPRDVQAMIRAGASTEQVAEMSGWTREKITRYEAPILAEREHVAALARAAYLPSFGRGPSPTLEKRAKERLVMRGLRPDEAQWDAWRQDGNPWAVSLAFEAGGRERRAVWHFDVLTAALSPQDDEALWLSTAEEDGYGASQPLIEQDESQPTAQPTSTGGHEPRSHAVLAGSSHGRPARPAPRGEEDPTRGGTQQPGQAPADGASAGPQASDRAATTSNPRDGQEAGASQAGASDASEAAAAQQEQPAGLDAGTQASEAQPTQPMDEGGTPAVEGSDETLPLEDADEQPLAPRQRQTKQTGRQRKGRPSVPSWDDIMFGGSKN